MNKVRVGRTKRPLLISLPVVFRVFPTVEMGLESLVEEEFNLCIFDQAKCFKEFINFKIIKFRLRKMKTQAEDVN